MERFSNKSGVMHQDNENGGWVMWTDVKPLDETQRLFEAQNFINKKLIFAKNKKPLTKMEMAELMVEFSNFYCG